MTREEAEMSVLRRHIEVHELGLHLAEKDHKRKNTDLLHERELIIGITSVRTHQERVIVTMVVEKLTPRIGSILWRCSAGTANLWMT